MTSINALRLDNYSGLCVCDEARYWNAEWMIFYTPEKIRSVVEPRIQKEQQLAVFLGTTGTSSIGDEIIDQTEKEITRRYLLECKTCGGVPPRFIGVEEVAKLSFDVMTRIKHVHVDDMLKGKFGFMRQELLAGAYTRQNQRYEITGEDTIAKSYNYLTFEGAPEDVKGIFGNSNVMAGFHPTEGFRIFYMTMRTPVCEEVQEIFLAQGSGRDTCDLVYCDFANSRTKFERRQRVDRVEALMAMLRGLITAFKLTAGVGGYPKIIYFDGRQENPENRVKEIFDRRSKLAAEVMIAESERLVSPDQAYDLIDRVIYRDEPFAEVNERFLKSARDPFELFHFLRGYRQGAAY